jgi:hypothetical protein
MPGNGPCWLGVVTAAACTLPACGSAAGGGADHSTSTAATTGGGAIGASSDPTGATDTTAGATDTSALDTTSSGGSNGDTSDGSPGAGGIADLSSATSATTSDGAAGAAGSSFDCSHRATFQPTTGDEVLSVGAFCDEVYICLPDSATLAEAQAAVPGLSCGAEANVFASVPGANCASADLICQWFMVYDVSDEDLDSICAVTSLTSETDSVLCRVFL